jgi:anti-sigma regulatory factor (Ser/Thr protein kinase)
LESAPFSLTLPSDARMVPVARAFVEAVCQACDLHRSATYALVLAAGEAVSNIIRHAHHSRPDTPLHISCRPGADCLELLFLDEGEPFDLTSVPLLDPTEMRLGGRGLYLMRSLMDEVTCARRQPHGNVLRLVKRFGAGAARRDCG